MGIENQNKEEIARNPLVSIIVITYNSSQFVLETLESAKAQTYQNLELIVSDDCSTDNTAEICQAWLEENKERFVRTELITVNHNTGIAPNCNRGLIGARGEWVKFIAGDDILMKECINDNIFFTLETRIANVIFSRSMLFIKNNNIIEEIGTYPLNSQKRLFNNSSDIQYQELLLGNFVWIAPTSFIRKKTFTVLGNFNERYPYLEDYPKWLEFTKAGEILYYFDKLTVLYRQSESVMRQKENWINKNYYNSFRVFFNEKVSKELKILDYKVFINKRLYLLRINILLNLFRNRQTIISKVFNRIFLTLFPNS